MANQKSWAEKRWWRGTIGSSLGVLLAILVLLPFGLQLVMRRQQAAPPLQQFYIEAYRSSCSIVRRPLVLPYVHQANGTKALASISDLAVLPPTAAGRFRVALTDAAVRAGARRVEFLRTAESGLPATCASLDRQIQLNAGSVRPRISGQVFWMLALGALALVFSVARSRRARRTMRRGHELRGPELLTREAFNRSKKA